MIWTIAQRELRSLFVSRLAWVVLAVLQFVLAYVFLIFVDNYVQSQAQIAGLPDAPGVTLLVVSQSMASCAFVLMLVVPILTMRLISDERRNRTLGLLLSAPLSMTEIVLGKYLGIMLYLMLIVAMLTLMPLTLLLGTSLDGGLLAANILGTVLLLACFAAAGVFMSAMTDQPPIAAISTFGMLFLLWILDWAAPVAENDTINVLAVLSMQRHYQNFLRGVISTEDLAYFVLFIILFLGLAIRRMQMLRA
jgi:ABC-2 type transport system permease protein